MVPPQAPCQLQRSSDRMTAQKQNLAALQLLSPLPHKHKKHTSIRTTSRIHMRTGLFLFGSIYGNLLSNC
ncbi:uncharacterized protein Dvir_GJ25614, isoform A [Drosophila virilis]|uniref:Uncharacterized protein, isoform A n=1 Tax=Drosophila virilis TaxID=7244 RepID=A0A0Q9WEB7_DROVI|nr:uncharacterized protein Dvir_GJ25614, isoform A [Drosophila virilis]